MCPQPGHQDQKERRDVMLATMIALGLLAATAITAASVQFHRDGYRRTPTLPR